MTDTANYQQLLHGAGFFDHSSRRRLTVLGPDRAKFLHNVTTNDVKKLAVGHGHEAFVTSLQGKTLGYVSLLADEDRILLRSDPENFATLLTHLQKYGVFDDVTLEDVSSETFEFHVFGSGAESILKSLGVAIPPVGDCNHVGAQLGEDTVRVVRESPAGLPGFTIIGPSAAADRVASAIRQGGTEHGVAEVALDLYDGLRIEAGTPVFGRDVTADNLPQELGRDARAISFVKGCYLGQETVARIDALGHVNKCLKGLRFPDAGSPVEEKSEITVDGKKVGTITSSAISPSTGLPIALAYVRATHSQEGTEVSVASSGGTVSAIVYDLPMTSASKS